MVSSSLSLSFAHIDTRKHAHSMHTRNQKSTRSDLLSLISFKNFITQNGHLYICCSIAHASHLLNCISWCQTNICDLLYSLNSSLADVKKMLATLWLYDIRQKFVMIYEDLWKNARKHSFLFSFVTRHQIISGRNFLLCFDCDCDCSYFERFGTIKWTQFYGLCLQLIKRETVA